MLDKSALYTTMTITFEEVVPNELLKRARHEKGWTQAELAAKLETTFETVSRWERGIKVPGALYRRKLCDLFGKTAAELGFVADEIASSVPISSPCVFLSSSYADAEHAFVASLKKELQARGVTVWSSRTVKKQSSKNKRNVLHELIRAAQVVLVIVSPGTQASHHVHDALRLARHNKRPVCAVWIDGEDWEECYPQDAGEPSVRIDARGEGRNEFGMLDKSDPYQREKIVTALEQMVFPAMDGATGAMNLGGTINRPPTVSEPIWVLPKIPRALIGREEELAKVRELLQSKQVRLVTLFGTGGIGKTSLALQVAMEMREHFADGVCFVSLAAIRDPDLVMDTIAEALGIRETRKHFLFEQMKVALRKKRLLLILDNFEHVQKASLQLSELLAACHYLKILVTSRIKLHISGEYELAVPPLALPDPTRLLESEALSDYASIAVFVQRAQDIAPNFQLTMENAHEIAEMCVRLDGLPLAIELAAARIRSLRLRDLLERLKQPAQVLTMTNKEQDVDERQRTLGNTIAWSYDLLTSEEQHLFRRLSVFMGGCKLEAVEAVCEATGDRTLHVWDGVESLLDRSLLHSTEYEGERRLRLLETIREFGLECLKASGEAEVTHQAHAEYYLALAEEAEPKLKGAKQSVWLTRLEQEQENLRAALSWLIEREQAGDYKRSPLQALRFCAALWWFWRLRGYWSEGRRWLEAALQLEGQRRDESGMHDKSAPYGAMTLARAKALCAAGDLAYYQDDYEIARPLLEESVMLYRTLGNERELAHALGILGVVMYMLDDSEATDQLLQESEKRSRALGSSWELSFLLRKLAHLAVQKGELQQAMKYAQEGLALAQKLGDKSLIASTLSTLGDIAGRQDDLNQVIEYNRESLALARESGDKLLTALALQNLGYSAALQGDLTLAVCAQEGLTLMRELGDRMFIAIAAHSLGYVTARQGNLAQARTLYREGLVLAQEIGDETEINWTLCGLAILAATEGQLLQAARLFGAVEAKLDINTDMNAFEREEYKRAVRSVRTQMGEKAFAAAQSEGCTMTPEQILATPRVPSPVPLPPPKYPDGLTEREVQVLCLVAKGLTDEQIAKQLVIAPRTVNSHLTSIYRKIGVSSDKKGRQVAPRIAAAHYVSEHDLC